MKCSVVKCRIRLAMTNSPNALFLGTPSNGSCTCNLRLIRSTNWPTQTMKPDRNALKGKVSLINAMKRVCTPAMTTRNAQNISINFNLASLLTCSLYDFRASLYASLKSWVTVLAVDDAVEVVLVIFLGLGVIVVRYTCWFSVTCSLPCLKKYAPEVLKPSKSQNYKIKSWKEKRRQRKTQLGAARWE